MKKSSSRSSSSTPSTQEQLAAFISAALSTHLPSTAKMEERAQSQNCTVPQLLAVYLTQNIGAHFHVSPKSTGAEFQELTKRIDRLSDLVKLSASHCAHYYTTVLKVAELVDPSRQEEANQLLADLDKTHAVFEEKVQTFVEEMS